MGSYCIAETGKIIKGLVEPLGFGARFGGDEFIAYMLDRSENAGVNAILTTITMMMIAIKPRQLTT